MGFSVSGATVVLLVGVLISVSTLYPALEANGERRHESLDAMEERSLSRQNTDVLVDRAVYNRTTDTLTVVVNNTGATTLAVERTDLLADGRYLTNATTAVDGDATRTIWAAGEQLTLETTGLAEPSRVKVVTEGGVAVTATPTVVG